MGIKGYLAMTAAEFLQSKPLLPPAWMSCHFSPWGENLTNFPQSLPQGSILIIDDSMPPTHHDALQIVKQLEDQCARLQPDCILLDFQRPNDPKTQEIVEAIVLALCYRVGVSQLYAGQLSCPVLLECPAPGTSLETAAATFAGRELWLEIAPEGRTMILTEEGCKVSPASLDRLDSPFFFDAETSSNYHWHLEENKAIFHIQRDPSCLKKLLLQADALGFTRAVGLYQQLGEDFFQ